MMRSICKITETGGKGCPLIVILGRHIIIFISCLPGFLFYLPEFLFCLLGFLFSLPGFLFSLPEFLFSLLGYLFKSLGFHASRHLTTGLPSSNSMGSQM